MKTTLLAHAAVVAAALALGAGSASAAPYPGPANMSPCFRTTDWQGWRAPSPDVLYLRVRMHDVYQVDLSASAPELMWPTNHLVSRVRGSPMVCSAIDLDLAVADTNGFSSPLFPKSIRKLTAEEVAAIPKKYRP